MRVVLFWTNFPPTQHQRIAHKKRLWREHAMRRGFLASERAQDDRKPSCLIDYLGLLHALPFIACGMRCMRAGPLAGSVSLGASPVLFIALLCHSQRYAHASYRLMIEDCTQALRSRYLCFA